MTDRETLADVDHTHPHTDEPFGGVYRRGPAVTDGSGPAVGDPERLRDVDHAPAEAETTAANALWERGGEREQGTTESAGRRTETDR